MIGDLIMTTIEKNRVYRIEDIKTLHTTAVETFATGIASAEVWDSQIQALEALMGSMKVMSGALISALAGVPDKLCDPDWETHKTWADNALSSLAGRIPQQDTAGAEALGIMTENTGMVPEMINDLAECIALAGSSLSLAEYRERVSDVTKQWDGETVEQNLILFESILLGMPEYVAYGADPVNMSTGNFVYRYTDLTTRGKSPLAFERTYNAMSRKKGILGRGWHHNWEKCIHYASDTVILFHEDGREEHFVKTDNENGYRSDVSGIRIEKTQEGYVLADTAGMLETYDESGHLITRWDKNGIQTNLTYEGEKLIKISHNKSADLKLCYNEKGELTGVSDHSGREVTFAYTGRKLSSVTDPEGNRFTYEYGPNGRIAGILDKRGVCIVENTYDEYRRITKQTFPDGGVIQISYTDKHNRVKLTAQNGSSVSYIHDSRFRDKKTVYEDGYEEWTYDENGHVSRRRDKNGNETFYVHDKDGRLLETKDALGAVTTNTYDKTGHPVSTRYANGARERFTYDGKGRLVSVCTKSGKETHLSYENNAAYPSAITLADKSVMHLLYDAGGNILSIRYPDGTEDSYVYDELDRVTESMDGNKNRTCYTYDGMDRIKSVKRPDGAFRYYTYNPMGEAVRIEDFDGHAMNWEYNAINKPSVYTDKQGRQTFMEYDLMWNISRMTDPEGAVTEYAYDGLNRLVSVTDPLGRNISFAYDPNGNRTKVTYPDGSHVQYEYDALNRVIKETDRAGRETKTTYDALGNVTGITDHAGNTTYFEYDCAGRKIKETDRCGAVTAYTYTDLGKTDTITHPGGRVERFHYGPGGVLKRHEKGDGTWEEYTYDKAGNKTGCTYPDGSKVTYEYDTLNRLIQTKRDGITESKYTYDAMGNMTSVEDAAGSVTRYEYYPSGKLRMVTGAMGGRVLYTYNARDELTGILQTAPGEEMTFHAPESIPEDMQGSHRIRYERDKAGRITAVINAHGIRDTYEYDLMDRVISHADPEGNRTTWEYHTDGQVKSVTCPDGKQVTLSYDALARLQRVKDFLGETVFAYDAEGRLLKSTDHNGQGMAYGYNPDGSRAFMQYPDGSKTTYGYDNAGRLTDIRNGEFHIGYAYDDYGRLSVCKRNNGIETLYHYNRAGYLGSLIHRDKDGILEEYGCTFDQRGNKTSVTRTSREDAYSLTQEYAYDALNRLVEIQENGKTVTRYLYDGYGNRIEEWQYKADSEPAIIKRTYDAMNRLIGDGQHTYTYDSLGNLTNVSKDGQTQTFAYDTTGLLSEAVQDGNVHRYINNALGCRVGSTTETGTTTYGIDYADPYKRITTEKDSNGNRRNYLWHDNILLGIPSEGIHILPDLFHSPVRVTDKEGNTQNLYSYDVYGRILKEEETIPMPFGFTGYLKEACKDLYYTGSREYDPVNGTFNSKDMYRYMDIQDPQSMNLYAYAKSNPLRYLDFDGHECIEEKSYLDKTIEMVLLGEFSDEVTGVGLGINLLLSAFGLDLLMDIRDLIACFTKNFKPKELSWWLTLGGTVVAFLPLVGMLKYADEAGDVLKYTDEAGDVVKNTGAAKGALKGGGEAVEEGVETTLKGGSPTDLTIMSRNSGRGNPGAITHFDVDLNTRQKNLLQQLPNCDSSIIINKGDVNLKDLAALTAKTGDEFAMFTRGSQRMIIRGNASAVNIDGAMAQELYNAGFKWSGHTHPGTGVNVKFASEGDMYILEQFNQTQSVIFDSQGNFSVFEIGE